MFILITAAIILFGIKLAPKKEFFEDSFSIGQTRALKGVFALVVMFHHLYGILLPSFLSVKYFKDVGFLMVGGFFLISGYGLMYGVKHKKNYLKGFFRKRILTLLIPYYIIDAVYVYIKYLTLTDPAQFKQYVIESVFGLQLWFVPVMVVLYVLFRLSFIGHEKRENKTVSPIILTVLTLGFIVGFTVTQHTGFNVLYGCNWNDTALCFVVGMWYCILKDSIKAFLEKYYYLITGASLIVFALLFLKVLNLPPYVWPTAPSTLIFRELAAVFFCIAVLLLSMKVRIGNGLINVCGDLSFELYLSHAIFITLFRWGPISIFSREFMLNVQSDDLFLAAVLVGSFVFSYAVHFISKLILKPIQKSSGK